MSRPLPPITPDTHGWWEATRERRLTVQMCRSCGHHQFYPRSLCLSCHGDAVELFEVSGRATILSFSVVHRSPDPDAFEAPYVVALVTLEEGPVLTTNLVDVAPHDIACDQPVVVRWEPLGDARHLPVFAPAPPQDTTEE